MNYQILILAALVAYTKCESDYPPPVFPHDCGKPDCSILSNRFHEKALFAHPDPNRYYQCAPYSLFHWVVMERWCICGTVFNPKTARCSFWWDEGWEPMCEWTAPPKIAKCERHYDKWVVEEEEKDDEYEESFEDSSEE